VTVLAKEFLSSLVANLVSPNTIEIVLGGSHVRGEATVWSDVDVLHLVTDTPSGSEKTYQFTSGQLVSIATRTLAWYQMALRTDETLFHSKRHREYLEPEFMHMQKQKATRTLVGWLFVMEPGQFPAANEMGCEDLLPLLPALLQRWIDYFALRDTGFHPVHLRKPGSFPTR
jgi:hypothetical protein